MRHRTRFRLATAFFALYFGFSLFTYAVPHAAFFPFFNWSLFVSTPVKARLYEMVITALEPGSKLEQPIPLHRLRPEFHRDWNPSPYKIIQRLGWLTDETAWQADLPASDAHMRNYFTDGFIPSSEQITLTRLLAENFLRDIPYAEYSIIRIDYDAQAYNEGKALPSQPVRSFIKGARP